MRKSFIIIIALTFASVLNAQVTIENLLSVPFPTDLKASQDGKHIAWVFNNKGVRNLFIADAPEFKARMLTTNKTDNGIDITSVKFTPDGNKILFTQGNSNNGKGEAANPALLQQETGLTVWIIDNDGKNLKKIGNGDQAVATPDNKIVTCPVSANKPVVCYKIMLRSTA